MYELARGLAVRPRDVESRAVQAHFIKHPMGLGALRSGSRRGKRQWNAEGWDRSEPAVISLERRRVLVQAIHALVVGGDRCEVNRLQRESLGGDVHHLGEECYDCPTGLVEACAELTKDDVTRYLSFVDTLLEMVSPQETAEVAPLALFERVFSIFPDARGFEGLAVFAIRQHPTKADDLIARLTSWHGFRAEFYVNGSSLSWRTLLRVRTETPSGIFRHLVEDSSPTGGPSCPLSEMVLVPRPWWETHE
jgi:hypothetical protein